MRVDLQIRDEKETLGAIIRGLDNRLTASENLAPEGIRGQVLTSMGPNEPPQYGGASGTAIPDVSADLNALALTVNQILAVLREKGIIAS